MQDTITRFLQVFDDIMSQKSMTQKEVCATLGFSSPLISQLRNGKTKTLRVEDVKEIAIRYNYSILWIVTGQGDMRASNDEKTIKQDIKDIKEVLGNVVEKLLDQILQPSIKPDAKTELTSTFRKTSN
jgi:transcriptional regulator with XRE-family HTH domain